MDFDAHSHFLVAKLGTERMGKGTYTGGHTKIFISNSGMKWEVPDRPAEHPDDSRRNRWDAEIGVETGRDLRKVSKQGRSFLSMCAVAFCNDVLTDSNPRPPPTMQKEVKLAGGNKRWIASNPVRLRLFEEFFKKKEPKR
jgi:hypothetical protein